MAWERMIKLLFTEGTVHFIQFRLESVNDKVRLRYVKWYTAYQQDSVACIHSQFESLGFVGKYDQSPTNIMNSWT
jgi:hypothetical protein